MNRIVEVIPYDINWPLEFEKEALLIKQALGSNCVAVYHIGSTSIPGLSAKPIIDILPVVKNILEVDAFTGEMEKLGYEAKGEHGIAFRRFFQKGKLVKTHNVHVYEESDSEVVRYLKFRDWMRSHPKDMEKYTKLKFELAKKYPNDILKYCLGKDSFIAEIDSKDGFKGSRMVQALTEREWNVLHSLRQEYFFNIRKEDPLKGSFNQKGHIHFVFYKNAEIIGYVHIQILEENQALLCLLTIHAQHRKKGFEKQFLEKCERWLSHQKIRRILVQSQLEATKFYNNQGYKEIRNSEFNLSKLDYQEIRLYKLLEI